ncbi:MAG: oligopeptide:H+ symporter, partial [Schleiferiaceae bacterium]|nr:oligopeptide:H+ symporter [Schleiferiaceae bacterium]
IGMLLGLFIFWSGRDKYKNAAGLEVTEEGMERVGPFRKYQAVMLGSLALIPLATLLIRKNTFTIGEGADAWDFPLMTILLIALFIGVAVSLIKAGIKEGHIWRDRMIALVIFMLINTVFWAAFEQAGTSLTLFADRNVDRFVGGWEMPASNTQFFNPFFIIIFGVIFSAMWVKLSKIGKNPSIPMKFAYGIFQLGLGFLVTLIGLEFAEDFKVPLLTLVFLYMLHTTGELFLSPIGLSMVTKLSPKSIAGTAMGGWFLSFAMANYAAGYIATFTGGESGEVLSLEEGLIKYTEIFSTIGFALVAFAIIIALLRKPLNSLMHGVE